VPGDGPCGDAQANTRLAPLLGYGMASYSALVVSSFPPKIEENQNPATLPLPPLTEAPSAAPRFVAPAGADRRELSACDGAAGWC
jgi:hypothetical protein